MHFTSTLRKHFASKIVNTLYSVKKSENIEGENEFILLFF